MGRQIIPTFTASIPEVAASRLVITGWSSSSFGLLNHHNNTGIAKENINHPFTGANQESTVKQGTKQKTARSMREPKTLPSMCKNLGENENISWSLSTTHWWEDERQVWQLTPGNRGSTSRWARGEQPPATAPEKRKRARVRKGGDRQPRPWQTIRYVNKISQTQWRFKFLYLS